MKKRHEIKIQFKIRVLLYYGQPMTSMPSNATTISQVPLEFLATSADNEISRSQFESDHEHIVAVLTRINPVAVTFNQIEAAMAEADREPFEENELYQAIIGALEQQEILVVETLADDQQWLDEDAVAEELADEVWAMLKKARLPLNEFQHPLLTADRERRLLEIYQDGQRAKVELDGDVSRVQRHSAQRRIDAGKQALEELMRCNLRLVTKVASRYVSFVKHLSLDDLIQEGCIGLYKAIERFDLNLNLRLSTYATWWIRQSIERAVGDTERTIRLPIHVHEKLCQLNRAEQRWLESNSRVATDSELAEAMGYKEAQVCNLRQIQTRVLSLDMPIGESGDTVLGDVIPHQDSDSTARLAELHILQETLDDLLDTLPPRAREVIIGRFGLFGSERLTLEAIGCQLGLTRERIRQIEQKTLKQLQRTMAKNSLQNYFE
jgi:RNA polymerase sigma factor (sigma-70 family)